MTRTYIVVFWLHSDKTTSAYCENGLDEVQGNKACKGYIGPHLIDIDTIFLGKE